MVARRKRERQRICRREPVIVDTHVHVISDDPGKYPKVKDAYDWPDFTAETLIATMDRVGIDRALIVQAYYTYRFDNSYHIASALAHMDRLRCICVIDQYAKDAGQLLQRLVEKERVAGVRLTHVPGGSYDDPRSFPVWECAAALGIPICISARLGDIPAARRAIERHPKVKVALEHMWAQPMCDPPYREFEPFYRMAEFPNVHVKTTPNNSHQSREGKGTPEHFFRTLVERFGARRIMWGSNYPAHWDKYDKIPERMALTRRDLAFLGEDDRSWILGESALALWPELRGTSSAG
jgi:L-fuconolactonase